MDTSKWGKNIILGNNVIINSDVILGHNVIIEDNVTINKNTFIDSNTIIRSNSIIGSDSNIGSNCIIGEYSMDFYESHTKNYHPLIIGNHALIRSGSIIYEGSKIGDYFQTGHQVTIREKVEIGNNVSIGTLSDIQGNCKLGNYVRLHSNVHIGQLSIIDDFVWLFPYVIFTNDPTPPSESFIGVHAHSFAVVATGSIILPGVDLGQDCLIGAGSIVTKSVSPYSVVVGNPARNIADVRTIVNKQTGDAVYPWRYHFCKYMPWEEKGFYAWYTSLTEEEKMNYMISHIIE